MVVVVVVVVVAMVVIAMVVIAMVVIAMGVIAMGVIAMVCYRGGPFFFLTTWRRRNLFAPRQERRRAPIVFLVGSLIRGR